MKSSASGFVPSVPLGGPWASVVRRRRRRAEAGAERARLRRPVTSSASESGRAFAGASISWSPFTFENSTENSIEPDSIPPSDWRLSSGTSNSIFPDTRRMMSSSLPT